MKFNVQSLSSGGDNHFFFFLGTIFLTEIPPFSFCKFLDLYCYGLSQQRSRHFSFKFLGIWAQNWASGINLYGLIPSCVQIIVILYCYLFSNITFHPFPGSLVCMALPDILVYPSQRKDKKKGPTSLCENLFPGNYCGFFF